MPDTNITIDANGNVTRGVPGQMTELDVSQKGGHATGRTEHVRAKEEKPAPTRRSRSGNNMSLDQIIGRTGTGDKAPAGAGAKTEKSAAAKTRATGRGRKPKEEAPPPAPESKPEAPAPVSPAPEAPIPQQNDDLWTQEAEKVRDAGLPYLTIQHNGMTLHFTQADIDTARATAVDKRDDMEQAIVDYGDRVDAERREKEAREAAAQPKQEPEPQPNQATAPGPVIPEEPPVEATVPAEEPAPAPSTGGSKKLDLGTSAPTHKDTLDEEPEPPALAPTGAVLGEESLATSSPLRRVSVQDICTTLELDAKDLLASLQFASKGSDLGINPALHLYYVSCFEGDTTYLLGYGSNIAYARVRGGVLRDCNNRFGIDQTCAWVNEMTWVIRRTDI